MMTPGQPKRDPAPCPPWCVTDHADIHGWHTGARSETGPFRGHPYDLILAEAIQFDTDEAPEVQVYGRQFDTSYAAAPNLYLSRKDAAALAGLVEMLAGATARQHRDLAAALRAACEATAPPAAPERAA
jgi:hypothetical protein